MSHVTLSLYAIESECKSNLYLRPQNEIKKQRENFSFIILKEHNKMASFLLFQLMKEFIMKKREERIQMEDGKGYACL